MLGNKIKKEKIVRTVILMVSFLMIAATTATYTVQPLNRTAIVDGDPSEWALPPGDPSDAELPMHTAGNPQKPQIATAYLRYGCESSTLYVLVEPVGSNVIMHSPEDAWVRIDGTVVVSDQSGNDGIAPDFEYVDLDTVSNEAEGWEASTNLELGSYQIRINSMVFAEDEIESARGEANLIIACNPTSVTLLSITQASAPTTSQWHWAIIYVIAAFLVITLALVNEARRTRTK
jgi:hypothetical protein